MAVIYFQHASAAVNLPFIWLRATSERARPLNTANTCSGHVMKLGGVVKGKLVMLFRRLVVFAQNMGRNRESENQDKLGPQFSWPYVMNSCVAMRGPVVSGTWIWHRQHLRWHHGYYRTRR